MLLPWYVNKTLQGAELDTVKQHLNNCLICNRELLNLQNLSGLINQASTFELSAQGSFSKLKQRLHPAEDAQQSVVSFARPSKWQSKINFKQRKISAPALALAAGVLLAVVLPRFMPIDQLQSHDYRTLSDSEITNTNPNELRVIFKENTSLQTIDQLLASIQGTIIHGPNEQSVYTIGIKKSSVTTSAIDRLSILRADAHVIFAEPGYASPSKTQAEKTKQ